MILVRNLTKTAIPPEFFRQAKGLFSLLNIPKGVEISVVLVPPAMMRRLNRRYRRRNRPTDVLAFGADPAERGKILRAGRGMLGEIFICPSIAKREAREAGIPFHQQLTHSTSLRARHKMRERSKLGEPHPGDRNAELVEALIVLLVHAIVHGEGHRHDTARRAKLMERKERAILRKLGLFQPVASNY